MREANNRINDPIYAATAIMGYDPIDHEVIALFEGKKRALLETAIAMLQKMKAPPARIQVVMTHVPMDIAWYSRNEKRFLYIEASVIKTADGGFTRNGIDDADPMTITKRFVRL